MDVFFSKVGKILRYWFYLRVACILFYISIFASILGEAKWFGPGSQPWFFTLRGMDMFDQVDVSPWFPKKDPWELIP